MSNRVRKYSKGIYQVLISGKNMYDSAGEMMGNWTDDKLRNYRIEEFSNEEDALAEAYEHPDINWESIIMYHKEVYMHLYKLIKSELEENEFIVEFEPKMMTAEELKNKMFDRVMQFGDRFSLTYNLNDVIGFHIINPWGKNLREIYRVLKANRRLRIVRHEQKSGIIRMIGETDVGSAYEIVLWPTLIAQWARWVEKHPELPNKSKDAAFRDIVRAQQQIEKTVNIR